MFQTTNAKEGPKLKDVVGHTTVNSETAEVLDCISVDPKKAEDFYRTVIKNGAVRSRSTPTFGTGSLMRNLQAARGMRTRQQRESWRWDHIC